MNDKWGGWMEEGKRRTHKKKCSASFFYRKFSRLSSSSSQHSLPVHEKAQKHFESFSPPFQSFVVTCFEFILLYCLYTLFKFCVSEEMGGAAWGTLSCFGAKIDWDVLGGVRELCQKSFQVCSTLTSSFLMSTFAAQVNLNFQLTETVMTPTTFTRTSSLPFSVFNLPPPFQYRKSSHILLITTSSSALNPFLCFVSSFTTRRRVRSGKRTWSSVHNVVQAFGGSERVHHGDIKVLLLLELK